MGARRPSCQVHACGCFPFSPLSFPFCFLAIVVRRWDEGLRSGGVIWFGVEYGRERKLFVCRVRACGMVSRVWGCSFVRGSSGEKTTKNSFPSTPLPLIDSGIGALSDRCNRLSMGD